jgi:hypothetical protein
MHPALMVTDLTDDEGKDFLARLEAEHRRRWALRRPRHRASDMVQRASGPSDDSPMARVPGGQPIWGAPSSQDRPKERGCPCGKGADTTIPSGRPSRHRGDTTRQITGTLRWELRFPAR